MRICKSLNFENECNVCFRQIHLARSNRDLNPFYLQYIHSLSRMTKRLLFLTISSLFSVVSFGQVNTNKDSLQVKSSDLKVTLLGTGTPQPLMDRFGPSILVEAGSQTLLFDAGRGCLQRLRQIDIAYDKIDCLFLTHFHSDHVVGWPDQFMSAKLPPTKL